MAVRRRGPPTGVDGGHLALREGAKGLAIRRGNALTVAAFTTAGTAGTASVTGLEVSYRPRAKAPGLWFGWIAERRTLLGTATHGGFGQLASGTVFAGIVTEYDAGPWRLVGEAEVGVVNPRVGGGFVAQMSSLATSAFTPSE